MVNELGDPLSITHLFQCSRYVQSVCAFHIQPKLALAVDRVLVDQCLEARIFTEWVPSWIELEHRNGETVGGDREQMIEQANCFVEFPGTGTSRRGIRVPIQLLVCL